MYLKLAAIGKKKKKKKREPMAAQRKRIQKKRKNEFRQKKIYLKLTAKRKKKKGGEFPLWHRGNESIRLGTVRLQLQVPRLAARRIQHCHELQYRLQMWLGSAVAVA